MGTAVVENHLNESNHSELVINGNSMALWEIVQVKTIHAKIGLNRANVCLLGSCLL